ncbi:MAG TPA: caspase family protein [Phnomibacter sp.]|nr:caspase family protein [Phnomibacter sp.]
MRIVLGFVLWMCSQLLYAQERSVITAHNFKQSASSSLKGEPGSRKVAIVVGISGYSSERLNLQYASSDASFFTGYLRETRSYEDRNIFPLLDSAATASKIYSTVKNMIDELVAGDELVLYFAGHGDVQDDEAFFLAWDASDSRNYLGAGGVFDLTKLDLYVKKLATAKKVKVMLVMDACHSGFDLHKDGILKAQDNMMTGFDNSTKMLGCGANEFSYEADSVRHGLFTWYLVQGLMGLADVQSDNKISSKELGTWVKQRVSAATQGRQNPIISSPDSLAELVSVTPESRARALALIRSRQFGRELASRGAGDTANEKDDPGLQKYIDRYNAFLQLDQLYQGDSSSLGVIRQLHALQSPQAQSLIGSLQNHLAEILETRSQLVLNEFLMGKSEMPPSETFYTAGIQSGLADSLLPDGDPRKNADQVMAAFHKAFSYLRYERYEKYGEAEQLLRNALAIEDRAAYIYLTMSYLMSYQHKNDSAAYYAQRASSLIPTWSHAKNVLGNIYDDMGQSGKALEMHKAVLAADSNYVWSYNNIANAYLSMNSLKEAERYFNKALHMKLSANKSRLAHDWAISYGNLGVVYEKRGIFSKAEKYYLLADSVDGSYTQNLRNLGALYQNSSITLANDGKKAEYFLKKAVEKGPYEAANYYTLADYYKDNGLSEAELKKADSLYRVAIALNPFDEYPYARLGNLYLDKEMPDSAYQWFKKGIVHSLGTAQSYYRFTSYFDYTGNADSAIYYYREALKKNPYFIDAAVELSKELLKKKDTANAEQTMLQLAAVYQQSPQVYYELGNYYFMVNDVTESLEAYHHSLQLDPEYIHTLQSLVYIYLQQNKPELSRKYFQQLQLAEPMALTKDGYMSLVVHRSLDIPVAQRYNWLKGFVSMHNGFLPTYEMLAATAYSTNTHLAYVLSLAQTFAQKKPESVSEELLKWQLLLCIETQQLTQARKLARQYIDVVIAEDPFVKSVAFHLCGYREEAKKIKGTLQANDSKQFGVQFRKIFAAL